MRHRDIIPTALLALAALVGCSSTPQQASSDPVATTQGQLQLASFPSQAQSAPRTSSSNHSGSAQPGQFDFYLLNLSWSPEFCFHHKDSPECAAHPGFIVHGLWPQNNDGTYPEHCSNAPGPANPDAYTDLQPTASLVEHEWTTHGTCSGLSADAYFALIRRARAKVRIPAAFSGTSQRRSATPDDILAQFSQINTGIPAADFALSCGSNYLTAIEACFDKNLNPVACTGVRTCRANSVRITPR